MKHDGIDFLECKKCNRIFNKIAHLHHNCKDVVRLYVYNNEVIINGTYKKGNEYLGVEYNDFRLMEDEEGIWHIENKDFSEITRGYSYEGGYCCIRCQRKFISLNTWNNHKCDRIIDIYKNKNNLFNGLIEGREYCVMKINEIYGLVEGDDGIWYSCYMNNFERWKDEI